MLSLTRRVGEEIVIGDPRKPLGVIRIVDVHGDKVRLSFDFDRNIDINRRELADQKAKQGEPPAKAAPAPGNGPAPAPAPGSGPASAGAPGGNASAQGNPNAPAPPDK